MEFTALGFDRFLVNCYQGLCDMLRRNFVLLIGCLLSYSIGSVSDRESQAGDVKIAPQSYDVGVAKIDITPDYPVRLSGFGFRRDESEGVQAAIYARALAIGSDPENTGAKSRRVCDAGIGSRGAGFSCNRA